MKATTRGTTVSAGEAAATSVLTTIAANLKSTAATTPNQLAYHKLSKGLHLVLRIHDGRYQLSIGREAPSIPSNEEVWTVVLAFAAPSEAVSEAKLRQAEWRQPQTGRKVMFNVIDLSWRERKL